jgi:hypothetical protein
LRWLILASLGYAAPSACGGRSLVSELDELPAGDDALGGSGRGGGSGGAANPARGGNAGAARGGAGGISFGGYAGTVMAGGTAGYATEPRPIAARPCEQPMALGGGFERCADGVVHRPRSRNCRNELPRAAAFDAAQLQEIQNIVESNAFTLEQIEAVLPCVDDADCVDGPRGYCALPLRLAGG